MDLQNEILRIKKFGLKKVETRFTTSCGKSYLLKDLYNDASNNPNDYENSLPYIVDTKPDLQVATILPYLFLGSVDVASDKELLDELQITHIVDATTMKIENFPESFTYKHMNILDLEQQKLLPHINDFVSFVNENKNNSCTPRILVHCMAGISRSVSLVCGYLMIEMGYNFEDAFQYIKERRPSANPNVGFLKQLKSFSK